MAKPEGDVNIPIGDEHRRCREALANEGAGVNIGHEYGETPLMFALRTS